VLELAAGTGISDAPAVGSPTRRRRGRERRDARSTPPTPSSCARTSEWELAERSISSSSRSGLACAGGAVRRFGRCGSHSPRWWVFLVDSGAGDTAHAGTDQADGEETRSLGRRTFRIVKRRWRPDELRSVRPLGFELELRDSANGHFLVGGGGLHA
jgi:hypothetical protein